MKKTLISLQEYGLSPTESLIYINLLQVGASSVLDISRKTKLNRSTVHLNVETLIKLGLVTQMQRGNKRVIIAEPPERLNYLLDHEKNKIKRKEDNLKAVISNIYDEVDNVKENTTSQVKYYEGRKSVGKLYDEILKSDLVRAYVNPALIWEVFPGNKDKFIVGLRKGAKVKDILSNDHFTKIFYDSFKDEGNIEMRFLPITSQIDSLDYLIYDDKITIVQPDEKNKVIAIHITNKPLAENSKLLFDLLWSFLPSQNNVP